MNKSSKETWIFNLFLLRLLSFFWFSFLSCCLSFLKPVIFCQRRQNAHTLCHSFLVSVWMLIREIIKESHRAEGNIDRYWLRQHLDTHTHTQRQTRSHTHFQVYFEMEIIAISHESPLHLQLKATEKAHPCVHVAARITMHAKSPFPRVAKTWLRQNWNKSITKHWSYLCSRGREWSVPGAWRESGGREKFCSMSYYAVEW